MGSELTNHVWQSTVFACAAGVLVLAFRKSRAKVRFGLWFTASLKFFVPFALLMHLGSWAKPAPAGPSVSAVVWQISEPFSAGPARAASATASRDWVPAVLGGVWLCGFAGVALLRGRGWLRVRRALRGSRRVAMRGAVETRISPGLLEPGVVGWVRPVLLLPEGIEERLTPEQLDAVLAHEACHVRRRDNLTAAMHMAVEAVFWFHPLVWWIGARLVAERERACDEEVLRLGGEPHVYAAAILQICRHYLESPLACVPGISGADLKQRIEAILKGRVAGELQFAGKAALALAALAALATPVVVGMLHAPVVRAQSQTPRAVVAAAPVPQAPERPAAAPQTATPQAAVRLEDVEARQAYAKEKYGSTFLGMGRIYVQYGPPDEIQERGGDPRNPAEIWRYHYLQDFRSAAEFEFPQGKQSRGVQINWPPPLATYQGEAGSAGILVEALQREHRPAGEAPPAGEATAGFPGRHASFLIYPPSNGSVLSVPLDGLSGRVDLLGRIRLRLAPGVSANLVPTFVANLRDTVDAAAGTYQAAFTLKAGSYACDLLVRERASGKMYSEVINFDVK